MNGCHPFIAIHSSLIDFQVIFPPLKVRLTANAFSDQGVCFVEFSTAEGMVKSLGMTGQVGGGFWATTWLQFVFNI